MSVLLFLFLILFDVEGAVDEEHPVEVVDFVLENARVEVLKLERGLGAAEVFEANGELGRAGHFSPDAGKTETAFLIVFGFFRTVKNFGIDDGEDDFVFFSGIEAHDCHTQIATTLRSRDAHAIFLPHGFRHLFRELPDVRRDLANGFGNRAKDGVFFAFFNWNGHMRAV